MALTETTGTSNDIVFAGIATLPKKRPITELSIMDANKDEYVTRHLVDGRIIYCDHRVSVVAGYMSEEVSGLNAFAFMHKDDFRWTMIGLRQSKLSHLNVINAKPLYYNTCCIAAVIVISQYLFSFLSLLLKFEEKYLIIRIICILSSRMI